MRMRRIHQSFVSVAIIVLSVLMLWVGSLPVRANSSLLDSKVARLEFDFQRLSSRVNQLSSQLGAPSLDPPKNTTRIRQPASAQPKTTVTREEFETLATLVVELKQEVRALRSSSPTSR